MASQRVATGVGTSRNVIAHRDQSQLMDRQLMVRAASEADVADIDRVCNIAWKGIWQGDRKQFLNRMAAFPECGIVVGLVNGRIEGYVSVQRASDEDMLKPSWDEATDSGNLTRSHNPEGEWLHGVGLAITPIGSAAGLTMALILHLYDYAVLNNLRGSRFVTRMPGYRKYSDQMTPEAYVLQQRRDKPLDPELRIMVGYGFRVVNPPIIFRDYVVGGGDPGSCGMGVMVEQLNAHYRQEPNSG